MRFFSMFSPPNPKGGGSGRLDTRSNYSCFYGTGPGVIQEWLPTCPWHSSVVLGEKGNRNYDGSILNIGKAGGLSKKFYS